jgi:hypothetical protein
VQSRIWTEVECPQALKLGHDEPRGERWCDSRLYLNPQPPSSTPIARDYAEKPNALLFIGSVLRERSP